MCNRLLQIYKQEGSISRYFCVISKGKKKLYNICLNFKYLLLYVLMCYYHYLRQVNCALVGDKDMSLAPSTVTAILECLVSMVVLSDLTTRHTFLSVMKNRLALVMLIVESTCSDMGSEEEEGGGRTPRRLW